MSRTRSTAIDEIFWYHELYCLNIANPINYDVKRRAIFCMCPYVMTHTHIDKSLHTHTWSGWEMFMDESYNTHRMDEGYSFSPWTLLSKCYDLHCPNLSNSKTVIDECLYMNESWHLHRVRDHSMNKSWHIERVRDLFMKESWHINRVGGLYMN